MTLTRIRALFLVLSALAATGCLLPTEGRGGEGGARSSSAIPADDQLHSPKDAAADVAIGTEVEATFSEAMDPSTLSAATFLVTRDGAPVAGAVTYSGLAATFAPAGALALGALYTATITTAVKDLAQETLAADHTWSFTTRAVADAVPPTVTATSPKSGAVNVAADAEVTATFSEALDPSTVTVATFTVASGGAPIAGAVTYAGTTATFAPSSALPLDGSFLARLSGVTDLAGNVLTTEYAWTFTTPPRPTVIATNPADGAQGVAIDSQIEATFSVPMAPATINAATFLVSQGPTPIRAP